MKALRAGDHNFFDAGSLEFLIIQLTEYLEVFLVTGPEQIVTAASFICQNRRLNAQEVEEPDVEEIGR